MILLIDNYDSFVHNLARYLQRLGQETHVVRNDATTAGEVRRLRPAAIVLSPGPCTPTEAGCSVDVVRELRGEVPILGVCLGHQAIAAALGGKIVRAPEPRHGRTSHIEHAGTQLFAALPLPLTVCRYHSLVVEEATLPTELKVTARAEDGAIMALQHATQSLFGVQFHPEAALTLDGYRLLANFLHLAGCDVSADVAALTASENRSPVESLYAAPKKPLTF
ncbi:MAG: aminodeoxychorismate/anthranilate synthase component II [Pirellulales bacterium]|nr:aminodeoxychorismate/anthranilate synthase component II [Pirellulales bacterium]